MDLLRKQLVQQAAGGFDHFAIVELQIGHPGWHRTFGVLFPKRCQLDPGFIEQVLDGIIVVGLVSSDLRPFRQVKVEGIQPRTVEETA